MTLVRYEYTSWELSEAVRNIGSINKIDYVKRTYNYGTILNEP